MSKNITLTHTTPAGLQYGIGSIVTFIPAGKAYDARTGKVNAVRPGCRGDFVDVILESGKVVSTRPACIQAIAA
jgi:hypothetical protein